MEMYENQAKVFATKAGKKALAVLEASGIKSVKGYTDWQLRFYIKYGYSWSYCCKIWEKYKQWCKACGWIDFNTWYFGQRYFPGFTIEDYSRFDDPELGYTDLSWGEPIDATINDEGYYSLIDC